MEPRINEHQVRHRAQVVAETTRANNKPIGLDCFKAGACMALICGAAYGEVTSASMGMNAAFPRLSDGTSTADAIMGMCYTLAFYALLGHVVVSSITGRMSVAIKWLLGMLGVAALLVMLVGMGLFSFSATFVTVGGDDGEAGLLAGLTGPALGLVGGCLFTVSFVASCHLADKLLGKLAIIAPELAKQAGLARLDRAINTTDACAARRDSERAIIAELEKPGGLVEQVAAHVGRIIGNVTAQAQEAVTTRRSHDGITLNDADDAPFRDVPLPVLERVLADLKQYSIPHFRTLLAQEK